MHSLCNPVVCLGFFNYYFTTKECKNVCVPLYMYRMNVWTCVCIYTHAVVVWNHASAEAGQTMIFTLGAFHSTWTGGKECIFVGTQCYSMGFTIWGRRWPAVQMESLGSWISCVLIHTHTVHSSMRIEERTQNTSLLLSCGCTVHLYGFKEIYANNFTYSISAFRC